MADRTVKVTLAAQASGYIAEMQKAGAATRATASEAEKLAQKREAFTTLGTAAVAFGAAALAATGFAVKAAMDWESAWAGVTKTVDGSASEMAKLSGELRGLAKELPASHKEIAAVAEAAGQLGVERENVAAFTKTMIDLGETTNLTATDAATQLARFMNVMGTSQSQVSNLGSAIVELGNNYATTEAEILEMSMRLSGAGKQVGLAEGEVFGLATALSSVGIEAEAGGSAISKVMINIASEVETGGDKLAKFAQVAGMSVDDFSKAWRDDAGGALAAFVTGLANAEDQGQTTLGVLADLEISEVRMRDALLRSAGAADQFTEAMATGNTALEENTALATEAEKRYATVESQLQIMSNRVNDAAINFGSVFLPVLAEAAGAVGSFADFLAGIPEPIMGLIGVLTVAVGVFALVGGAALLAVPKIAQFKLALQTLNITGASFAKGFGKGGGVLLALTAIVGGLSNLGREGTLAADKLAKLNAAVDTGDLKALDAQFELTGNTVQGFKGVLEGLTSRGASRTFLEFVDGATFGLTSLSASFKDNEAQFRALGTTLASVAQDDFGTANAQFQRYIEMAGGGEEATRALLDQMPEYEAVLYDLAAAQGISLSEQGLLNLAMGEGDTAARVAAASAKENESALKDMSAASQDASGQVSDLAQQLRDFGSTALDARAAERQFEQAVADASKAVDDNGKTLDITTQKGRDNQAALDDIASAATNAAAATWENTRSESALQGSLDASRARLIEAARRFGMSESAARDYANQVLATPEAVMTAVGLQGIETAEAQLARLTRERYVNVLIRSAPLPGQRTLTNAVGNMHDYQQFAGGGFASGIYAGRPGGIHKFAEPETGWEAYISGKPGMEKRNLGIAYSAIDRLQAKLGSYQPAPRSYATAGGGTSGSSGGVFVGDLVLDSGEFMGTIRGEIRAAGEETAMRQRGRVIR